MKIYISADMEGVSGVVHREHTTPVGVDYDLARRLMTWEVNAAVDAAFESGASEVVVSDSHGGNQFRSILMTELHPGAQLITGGPRLMGQVEGLDGSFSMLILLGYHVRHATFGVLDHTTNGQAIARVTVNGRELGEVGLNAHLAGHYGVPVGVVTGDDPHNPGSPGPSALGERGGGQVGRGAVFRAVPAAGLGAFNHQGRRARRDPRPCDAAAVQN